MANTFFGFTNDVYKNIYNNYQDEFIKWAALNNISSSELAKDLEGYLKLFASENPNLSINFVLPENTGSPYPSQNPYLSQIGYSFSLNDNEQSGYFNKTPLWANFSPQTENETNQQEMWQQLLSDENFLDSLMSPGNNNVSDFDYGSLITQGYKLDYDPVTGTGTLVDPSGNISTLQSVANSFGDTDLNKSGDKLVFVPQSGVTTQLNMSSIPTVSNEYDFGTLPNGGEPVTPVTPVTIDEEPSTSQNKEDVVTSQFVTPTEVDESVYKSLPEDLALALSPIDRAWTPANNFLNAASIVNPGAALAYGLTTVGGDVAQALLDKANIDVPITYDRATDERMLNRYADLLGADIVKEDGNYGLKYSKAAAERAGLSQPTTGGTSLNQIRAYYLLDPFETDVLVPDNLVDSVAESAFEERKRIIQNLYPYTSESHSYRTSDYNNSSIGTGTTSGDSILNQSKNGTSIYTVGTN